VVGGVSATAGGAGDAGSPRDPFAPAGVDPDRAPAPLDLAALVALEEPARDGRLARGQRTRRNVAEALMELLLAGETDPTAKAVARRAGVSLRLVFHHFADMDDLYQFVGALLLQRQWAEMPQLSPQLSLPVRIERTVAHRAALFEQIAEVRRALACRAPTCPGVREALAASDNLFLEDLKATFAPELTELPTTGRDEYVGAMDAGVSWEVWDRLRTTSGVPVRSARRVMSLMLGALFAATEDGGGPGTAVRSTPRAS
jgi:TetR/AcrR family transcriptional regulator, regulator of autoinduction and epiphytic fitness